MLPAMRVAVDATSLLGPRSGVGVFTQQVLTELGARPDLDVTAFPISVRGRRALASAVPAGIRVRTPLLPARPLHRLWARSDRPAIDRAIGHHDVVYGPNFVVPPSAAARVVTVHDLTCVRFPELCEPHTLAYPDLVRRAVDAGAWVHAVTEAVRLEVIDLLGVDENRVVTVHEGPPDRRDGDPVRGRALAGTDDYVLAVGTVEPRKDLPSLLHAIDRLAPDHADLRLVHVGSDGWGTTTFDDTLADLGHPDRIRRLGRRSDEELRHLYAGARVVAYPSIYEGFGLPVLEAMSAGVPVVATSVPAIVEVAGEAALLVDVGDVDALADALDRVWTDDGLRNRLRTAGAARVERYSWSACADGLVALFARAVTELKGR